MRQVHAACGKESTVEQGKIQRLVNPRLRLKNILHTMEVGMDHLCGRQTMYHKAHDVLRNAREHKSGGYRTILESWHDDDKYRKSLSDIGWTEEQIIQCDEIALGDHSDVAARQE